MKKFKKLLVIMLAAIMALPLSTMPAVADTASNPKLDEITFDLSKIEKIEINPDSFLVYEEGLITTNRQYSDKYIFTGQIQCDNGLIEFNNETNKKVTFNLEFRDVTIDAKGQSNIVSTFGDVELNINAIGENKFTSENDIFEMPYYADNITNQLVVNVTVPVGTGSSGKHNSLSYEIPYEDNFYSDSTTVTKTATAEYNTGTNTDGKLKKILTYLPSAENYQQGEGNTHTYVDKNGKTVTEKCYKALAQPGNGTGEHNIECTCGRVLETESHDPYISFIENTGSDPTHSVKCIKCGEVLVENEPCVKPAKPSYAADNLHSYACEKCGGYMETEQCIPGNEVKDFDDYGHVYKCLLCGAYSTYEDHIPSVNNSTTIIEPAETEWGSANSVCKICNHTMENVPIVPTGVYYIEVDDENCSDVIYRIYVNGELTVFVPYELNALHPVTQKRGIEINADKNDDVVITAYIADDEEDEHKIRVYEPGSMSPVFERNSLEGVEPYSIIWSNKETADYSALSDAIDKIPEHLDKYEKETVISLLEKINMTMPHLSVQNTVDKWTEDILNSLDKLKKSEDTSVKDAKNIKLVNGNHLVITKTGYKINNEDLVPWTGDYTLTTDGIETYGDITVESGVHNITIKNLFLVKNLKQNPFRINGGAMVNLNIEGDNFLQSIADDTENNISALYVMKNAVLNISGDGSLYARCSGSGAAIGSDVTMPMGTINVYDGEIGATSLVDGAGIGTGLHGAGGILRIYGGTINSTSGNNGAGIGGGERGNLKEITIYGGTIHAVSMHDGAGIGGGRKASAGDITVYGGNIDASGDFGAGIGIGKYGKNGSIKIHGGTIKAEGDHDSAGIGGSEDTTVDLIEITGGDITAIGDDGAGIGGGDDSNGGKIKISGGNITAISDDGNAIGGGRGENAGNVLITGGTFYLDGDSNDIGSEDSNEPDEENNKVIIDGGCFFNIDKTLYDVDCVVPLPVNSGEEAVLLTVLNIKDANGNNVADGPVYIELTDGSKHLVTALNGQTVMYLPENVTFKSLLDVNQSADFTELNKVVNTIPEDLNGYTEASVDNVNNILNRIDREATIGDQNMVDTLTAELEQAVKDLRSITGYKPDEPVDPDDNKPSDSGTNKPGKPDADKPAKPDTDKPVKSDAVKTDTVKDTPKTGDSENIMFWMLLLLGAGTSVAYRIKKED